MKKEEEKIEVALELTKKLLEEVISEDKKSCEEKKDEPKKK